MTTFLNNRYSKIYYKIVDNAKQRDLIRSKNDGCQTHHIIPRALGGSNSDDNLVVLTYKEHRVCHRLLINMTVGKFKYKMMYAYRFFNKHYDISKILAIREVKPESYEKMVRTRKAKGSYKTGKDNIFSTPDLINMVRKRMVENNPMKNPDVRIKSINNRRRNRALKGYIPPRVLKDKFITPVGVFKTKKDIIKLVGIPEWTLNTIYNNLDALPTSNGRKSKNLDHLNIDYSKTWRENGFSILPRN